MAASRVLGLRLRTQVRDQHLAQAGKMLAIGCVSVGTDQVAIHDVANRGIPGFNAPHASTRSVAELALGCIIGLARRLGDQEQRAAPALHVPETPRALAMIGAPQIAIMRHGSDLLNLSRGTVVDAEALREGLRSGHLGGAARDVHARPMCRAIVQPDAA